MTKKIFKSIGLIALAIAVAIGSFFVPMQKRGTSHLASADDTSYIYSFSGSNIYMPLDRSQNNSGGQVTPNQYFIDFTNIGITFTTYTDRIDFSFTNTDIYFMKDWSLRNFYVYNFWATYLPDNVSNSFSVPISDLTGELHSRLLYAVNGTSYSTSLIMGTYAYYLFLSSPNFNGNVKSIKIYSADRTWSTITRPHNIIQYADSNNNYLEISFPIVNPGNESLRLAERTYYVSSEITTSDAYNQGYNDGLSANQSTIYDSAYDAGYATGFDNGKILGASSANDYSFFSLFGAIFDAPVTLFTSLLNFDFLGINLWAFVTSLLTLSAILFIIKLFIRR